MRNLINRLKSLLKKKKTKKNNDDILETLEDLDFQFYLLDGLNQAHLVIVTKLIFYKNGGFDVVYKSSSDLEARGLVEHLNKAIHDIYIKDEVSND